MRVVDVYYNDIRAGLLTERLPGKDYTFEYEDSYIASDFPPVAIALSKQNKIHRSETLFPFFANILPEGINRAAICRWYKVDETDLFGLLSIMADGDFIGAISVRNARKE